MSVKLALQLVQKKYQTSTVHGAYVSITSASKYRGLNAGVANNAVKMSLAACAWCVRFHYTN